MHPYTHAFVSLKYKGFSYITLSKDNFRLDKIQTKT